MLCNGFRQRRHEENSYNSVCSWRLFCADSTISHLYPHPPVMTQTPVSAQAAGKTSTIKVIWLHTDDFQHVRGGGLRTWPTPIRLITADSSNHREARRSCRQSTSSTTSGVRTPGPADTRELKHRGQQLHIYTLKPISCLNITQNSLRFKQQHSLTAWHGYIIRVWCAELLSSACCTHFLVCFQWFPAFPRMPFNSPQRVGVNLFISLQR